jgi:hypothetical protein
MLTLVALDGTTDYRPRRHIDHDVATDTSVHDLYVDQVPPATKTHGIHDTTSAVGAVGHVRFYTCGVPRNQHPDPAAMQPVMITVGDVLWLSVTGDCRQRRRRWDRPEVDMAGPDRCELSR